MNRVRKGWLAERLVKEELSRDGYDVWDLCPSAPADLLALRPRKGGGYDVKVVEVKFGSARLSLREKEFAAGTFYDWELWRLANVEGKPYRELKGGEVGQW